MARVFELPIPTTPKFVLMAMADPARDDGTNCYPSTGTLAKKTSLSERAIQHCIDDLERAGYIKTIGTIHVNSKRREALRTKTRKRLKFGPGITTEYAITLDQGEPSLLSHAKQQRLEIDRERRTKRKSDNPERRSPLHERVTPNVASDNPERRVTVTPNVASDNPERRSPESKSESLDAEFCDGERAKQKQKQAAAATDDRVIKAFYSFKPAGISQPFGNAEFQAMWTEVYWEMKGGDTFTDAMEQVHTICKERGIPGPWRTWWKLKARVEDLELRESA